jgi:hypothetical protein
MKNIKRKIAISGALFVALWTAQTALAWYDPSTGRWLTRDPVGEPGFQALQRAVAPPSAVSAPASQPSRWVHRDPAGEVDSERELAGRPDDANLYAFVENKPTTEIDPFGLFLGFGYGNWCGWSRSGQGGDPIDEVDAACQKHDNCLATWADACKFKFCNVKFCRDVARANCHGDKACKRAKRKILIGCGIIVPIPPFIFM